MKTVAGFALGLFFMWLAYSVGVETGREIEIRHRARNGEATTLRSLLAYAHGRHAHPSMFSRASDN